MLYRKYFKVIFDFVASLLLMPVLVLVTIVVAIVIKFDDQGPVFYVSKRIGKNGKIFNFFKYRSMKINSEDIRLDDGSTFNSPNDTRVTRFGRFLRKTSIDELPQIVNVLLGKMSFIGPRPDPEDWISKYPEQYLDFLKCKPGITGYNQAFFRNSTNAIEKMKNDLYYYKNLTFLFDVKILIKTISTMISKDNLYKSDGTDHE